MAGPSQPMVRSPPSREITSRLLAEIRLKTVYLMEVWPTSWELSEAVRRMVYSLPTRRPFRVTEWPVKFCMMLSSPSQEAETTHPSGS